MSTEITLKVNGITHEGFKTEFESTIRIFKQVVLQSKTNVKNEKGTYSNYHVTEDAFELLYNQLVQQRTSLFDLNETNKKYQKEFEEATFNLEIVFNIQNYLDGLGKKVHEEKGTTNKMFLTVIERKPLGKSFGGRLASMVKNSFDKTEFGTMIKDFFYVEEDEAGNVLPKESKTYYDDNRVVQSALNLGRKVHNYFYLDEYEEVPVETMSNQKDSEQSQQLVEVGTKMPNLNQQQGLPSPKNGLEVIVGDNKPMPMLTPSKHQLDALNQAQAESKDKKY